MVGARWNSMMVRSEVKERLQFMMEELDIHSMSYLLSELIEKYNKAHGTKY
jgi:predicted DNA-binding protein